jgi:hypothetical protein
MFRKNLESLATSCAIDTTIWQSLNQIHPDKKFVHIGLSTAKGGGFLERAKTKYIFQHRSTSVR